jgi:hypothetical protein
MPQVPYGAGPPRTPPAETSHWGVGGAGYASQSPQQPAAAEASYAMEAPGAAQGMPQASMQRRSPGYVVPGAASGGTVAPNRNQDDLWHEFRKDPREFWDNRGKKMGPRSPDFKHKRTGEALWVTSSPEWFNEEEYPVYSGGAGVPLTLWGMPGLQGQSQPSGSVQLRPGWLIPLRACYKHVRARVSAQCAGKSSSRRAGKTGMSDKAKEMQELWQLWETDPSAWHDNRNSKTNPRQPDFVNKVTKAALWLNTKPAWVSLEALGDEQRPARVDEGRFVGGP